MSGLHPGLKVLATALGALFLAFIVDTGASDRDSEAASTFRALVFCASMVGWVWWIWA